MLLYILLLIFLFVVLLGYRLVTTKRKNAPVSLFAIARKSENDGYFEEALFGYEKALVEVKRRNSDKRLELSINEKLKVLHTIIDYNRRFAVTHLHK